jgi:hypothetical protein
MVNLFWIKLSITRGLKKGQTREVKADELDPNTLLGQLQSPPKLKSAAARPRSLSEPIIPTAALTAAQRIRQGIDEVLSRRKSIQDDDEGFNEEQVTFHTGHSPEPQEPTAGDFPEQFREKQQQYAQAQQAEALQTYKEQRQQAQESQEREGDALDQYKNETEKKKKDEALAAAAKEVEKTKHEVPLPDFEAEYKKFTDKKTNPYGMGGNFEKVQGTPLLNNAEINRLATKVNLLFPQAKKIPAGDGPQNKLKAILKNAGSAAKLLVLEVIYGRTAQSDGNDVYKAHVSDLLKHMVKGSGSGQEDDGLFNDQIDKIMKHYRSFIGVVSSIGFVTLRKT